MLLYHGTSESKARLAMIEGLQPRGESSSLWEENPSSHDHVYLTNAYAGYFASHAAGDDVERWAIIEIDTDLLPGGDDSLFPDEDFLEQASRGQDLPKDWDIPEGMEARTKWFRERLHWFQHLWPESLKGLGNCTHEGEIPPEAIRRVAFFDSRKNPTMAMMALDPAIAIMNYTFVGEKHRTLTKWFVGDEVSPIVLAGVPPGVLPPELLSYYKPHVDALTKHVEDRSSLEVIHVN